MVTEPKDTKLTVLVAESDLRKLRELAEDSDESTAKVVRTLIRNAYDLRFGDKKPKKK
jgi:flagellar biosynthesis/type III secretory pathway M-ring protein FliF/YscJ